MGLRTRKRRPEIMDDPDLEPRQLVVALNAIGRINALSRTEHTYFGPLVELQQRLGLDRLRILDVACGGGDVSRRLWRLAETHDLDWRIGGCDISPVAIELAQSSAFREGAIVHYFTHDMLVGPPPGEWDAVICSLFLHHLDEEPAVTMLRAIARPGNTGPHLILINDLDRCRVGWVLAHAVSRLMTRSHVIHTDAPRSVEGAFTPQEALQLADRAGMTGASIRGVWPWRWLLSWTRT